MHTKVFNINNKLIFFVQNQIERIRNGICAMNSYFDISFIHFFTYYIFILSLIRQLYIIDLSINLDCKCYNKLVLLMPSLFELP